MLIFIAFCAGVACTVIYYRRQIRLERRQRWLRQEILRCLRDHGPLVLHDIINVTFRKNRTREIIVKELLRHIHYGWVELVDEDDFPRYQLTVSGRGSI